jgi:deazaflavin-dependent oxidoreductase (nitroreductase family)
MRGANLMASGPPKAIVKFFTSIHIFLYRISKGKLGRHTANLPVLLLTTIGRKTGRQRTTPVVYLRDGDDYLISASNGGFDSHSTWYYNLVANPEVQIEIEDRPLKAHATITEDKERDRLYELFKKASKNFVNYEQSTSRIIPVVRLTPV